MEKISIKKAMTRLPCLPSSNFALDILNGHDADIFPKDFLSGRFFDLFKYNICVLLGQEHKNFLQALKNKQLM